MQPCLVLAGAVRLSYANIAFSVTYYGFDVFRHLLLMFQATETVVFGSTIANVVNGNILALSNHRVGSITYWTGTMIAVANMMTMMKGGLGSCLAQVASPFVL